MAAPKSEKFSKGATSAVEDEFSDEDQQRESGGSSGEDEKSTTPSKNAKFNRDGLNEKLEDIKWPEDVDWIHSLAIDIHTTEVDVNDDLAREHSFYSQALQGTKNAFEKLESMGLPFLRPSDYYAEMVKSDAHMERVKGKLLAEKKEMEEAEERKKAREAKRLSKEVQSQKLKERAAQKKSDIESVKKWRKQREKGGKGANEELGEIDFEKGMVIKNSTRKAPNVAPGDRSGGKSGKWKSRKREEKDAKFGFGGRKGGKKQNNSSTAEHLRNPNRKNPNSFANKRRRN